jgi:hypothetical protein
MSMAAPAPPIPATARPLHRPIIVAILAALVIIAGALVLIAGLLLALGLGLLGGFAFGGVGAVVGVAIGAVIVIVGAIMLIAGLGLWRLRSWAWWLTVIVVVIDLIGAGLIGKIALGVLLVYLIVVRKYFNQ